MTTASMMTEADEERERAIVAAIQLLMTDIDMSARCRILNAALDDVFVIGAYSYEQLKVQLSSMAANADTVRMYNENIIANAHSLKSSLGIY